MGNNRKIPVFSAIRLKGVSSIILVCLMMHLSLRAQGQFMPARDLPPKYKPVTWVDNLGYWRRLAELGLVTVQPASKAPPAIRKSSKLSAQGIATYDSPDIPVTESESIQSENSIFIDPDNGARVLNSNNSHMAPYQATFYGADAFVSQDSAQHWEGTFEGPNGYNMGDPSVVISRSGRLFAGYIYSSGGQAISYSDDDGVTWHARGVASAPAGFGNLLDKNHLTIDNSLTSPYTGNLYDGWTVMGGNNTGQVQVSRSMDNGLGWQMPVVISKAVNAGSHNQGINLQTGPGGEVYGCWAIYDSWPANEKAIGFNRSLNGGANWGTASRVATIKGVRYDGVNKSMRVNSFPSMAVDNSFGPGRGNVYIVWTARPIGNTTNDVDLFFVKSTDHGETWDQPTRINSDPSGLGKQHFSPWVCCDPDKGYLSVVFYDDRNVSDSVCETWVAISKNEGETWQEFRVSDVAFSPVSITGFSDNYFGDYIGIASRDGMVYPCWTDNRNEDAMSFVSPFRIGPPAGQPYEDFYKSEINDTLTGNANGMAEFGETLDLSLSLRNIGTVHDSAVQVSLSSDSPWIRWVDSSQFYGNFEANELKFIHNAFRLQVSDSATDHHQAVINVKAVNYADSTYLSSFILETRAPQLKVGPFAVQELSGNGNNLPDPGETLRISTLLTNTGLYPVDTAFSRLKPLQSGVMLQQPTYFTPGLNPGKSDSTSWIVTLDPSLPRGTFLVFQDSVYFGPRATKRDLAIKAGTLTEDWEWGDFGHHPWKNSGDKPWAINNFSPYEGIFCAKSGYIDDGQKSELSIQVDVAVADSVSFYRKVSSEHSFDFLNFFIDDYLVGKWSGEKEWARVAFPVMPGKHTLTWQYAKDEGISVGLDQAKIDLIYFPVQQLTTVNAGRDTLICAGTPLLLAGQATNYVTHRWISSGTGSFSDSSRFDATYYPSASDIEKGSIQLVLKVSGYSFGEVGSDTLNVTYQPHPTLYAGADSHLCTADLFETQATATNYSLIHWSSFGDGTFITNDTLHALYQAGPAESQIGYTRLLATLTPLPGCSIMKDTVKVLISASSSLEFTGDTTLCKGDSARLDLNITGPGPWRIYMHQGEQFLVNKPHISFWVRPQETTVYQLDSLVSQNSCVFKAANPVTVTVNPLPVGQIRGPAFMCAGRDFLLDASTLGLQSYQWIENGSESPFIKTALQGASGSHQTYTLKIVGENGCPDTLRHQVAITDNCPQISVDQTTINVFPNPSTGVFNLQLSAETKQSVFAEIFDSKGKLIASIPEIEVLGVQNIVVDLNGRKAGIYPIRFHSNGKNTELKLVVL